MSHCASCIVTLTFQVLRALKVLRVLLVRQDFQVRMSRTTIGLSTCLSSSSMYKCSYSSLTPERSQVLTLPLWISASTCTKLTVGVASVPEGKPIFVVKLQDYMATEKEEVTMSCELSKDVPVVWYHGEKELKASKTLLIRSEGTRRVLVLKKVECQDQGKYMCDCGTDKTEANIGVEGEQA